MSDASRLDVFASPFRDARPAVAVVGAGAMGRALALRFDDQGFPVQAVISRTRASAEALARAVGAPMASDQLADIPAGTPLVVLAVPDDQLPDLAEQLTGALPSWRETVVMHTSGACPAAVLEALEAEGAHTLAFHPLQSVPAGASARALDGAYVGLEGAPRAVAAGIEVATGLGLRYFVLSAEAKPRYHLAAAVASNFLAALVAVALEILSSLDVDRRDGLAMLRPLLQSTLDNVARTSPEDALTGPVVRGDLGTLRAHGLALREHLPHLLPVYGALSVEAVRVAVRSGRLAPEQAERLLELVQRMLTTPLPPRRAGSRASGSAAGEPSGIPGAIPGALQDPGEALAGQAAQR
ncbi:MAG: Rossmann-like and DUF2520 domain-containing protein [Rubricoccaceae bacterium]